MVQTVPPEAPVAPLLAEALGTLRELRLYKIELEMQNDELRRTNVDLDTANARYLEFYDHAPVGYCTLSEDGLILEANLTLAADLGEDRNAMVGQPFTRFLASDDQNIFYLHHNLLLRNSSVQACELRMARQDGTAFWVHLEGNVGQDSAGAPVSLEVVVDLSERNLADETKAKLQAQLLLPRGEAEPLDAKGAVLGAGLTVREAEVLALVGQGLTSRQIGAALFISPRTVDAHRRSLMGKLSISNGPGLVKFAIEHGFDGLRKQFTH